MRKRDSRARVNTKFSDKNRFRDCTRFVLCERNGMSRRTKPPPCGGGLSTNPDALFLARVLVGVDEVAALVLGRPQHRRARAVAELVEVARPDVLHLGGELPRL